MRFFDFSNPNSHLNVALLTQIASVAAMFYPPAAVAVPILQGLAVATTYVGRALPEKVAAVGNVAQAATQSVVAALPASGSMHKDDYAKLVAEISTRILAVLSAPTNNATGVAKQEEQ